MLCVVGWSEAYAAYALVYPYPPWRLISRGHPVGVLIITGLRTVAELQRVGHSGVIWPV
jgi:hypothetical protein